MSEDIKDLQQKMLTAYRDGDRRLTGMLADKILRIDLQNPAAWQVVYNLLNNNQPMPEFQRWFTAKYFPNRLKDLKTDPEPATVGASEVAQPTSASPQSSSSDPSINTVSSPSKAAQQPCPPNLDSHNCCKCGTPYTLGTIFCGTCGQFLAAPAANTGELLASAGAKYCPDCGTPFSDGAAFCKECGCARTIIPDEKRGNDPPISDADPLARLLLNEIETDEPPAVSNAEKPTLQPEASALLSTPPTTNPTPSVPPGTIAQNYIPMAAPINPAVLARALRSENFRDVKHALNVIREQKLAVMTPLLLETYDVPRVFTKQNLGEAYTSAVIAALSAICTASTAPGMINTLRHLNYYVTPGSSATAARALAGFGMYTEALNQLDHWLKPAYNYNTPGYYFPAILACGDIPTPEAINKLLVSVSKERKLYESGYAPNFIDSVSFLGINANTIVWDRSTPLCSLLLTAPQQIHTAALKNAPPPLLMMLAYHCYADALTNICRTNQRLILEAAQQHDLGIQLAVLGMAMGQNRMEEARIILRKALEDSHWAVRASAYDGLMMQAEKYNRPPDGLITAALLDADVRVVLSAASAMLATGRPDYEMHILKLIDEGDSKRRGAFLQPIATLAARGNTSARAMIEKAATSDVAPRVREQAAEFLKMLA